MNANNAGSFEFSDRRSYQTCRRGKLCRVCACTSMSEEKTLEEKIQLDCRFIHTLAVSSELAPVAKIVIQGNLITNP